MTPNRPRLLSASARFWVEERGRELGRPASLDDIPDERLDQIADQGFDWLWLLGVWQTGDVGPRLFREHPEPFDAFRTLLPDFSLDDICGSPYAITGYRGHADFGGTDALTRLRARLAGRGVKLMLDFVPNHTARDHPWTIEHPEYYVHGTEADLAARPVSHAQVQTDRGPAVLAMGKDPYFPAWPDTFQLNYHHQGLRAAMRAELAQIAGLCDGVRCDMAMLVLPEVFTRTWGDAARPADGTPAATAPFWPDAIQAAHAVHPDFLFLAEAYWDLEWALQQQGFNLTYDKRLYDRLRDQHAGPVRDHLRASLEYQNRSVRFLENHDEPRSATVFPGDVLTAAATVAYLTPGAAFFHDGQLEGRRIHTSIHLRRRPPELPAPDRATFYAALLGLLRRPEIRSGSWRLVDVRPAWDGNPTAGQFIAMLWSDVEGRAVLVVVNYGPSQGQCFVPLPCPLGDSAEIEFRDQLGPAVYRRDTPDLKARGLYLDMLPWGRHAFQLGTPGAEGQ